MTVDQKILTRLDELIEMGQKVLGSRRQGQSGGPWHISYDIIEDKQLAKQWGLSCLNLIERVFKRNSVHFEKFNEAFPNVDAVGTFLEAFGMLKAAKDDYEKGYLFEARVLIRAEVFDDLIDQAKHLLDGGYYQPAAVIAGAVLEDGLRELCQRRGITLPPKTTIDPMNVALAKDDAYSGLVQKRITALAAVRNSAAHGKWSEFTADDVKEMIGWVRTFMEQHFS
jgi:hypothetical protein